MRSTKKLKINMFDKLPVPLQLSPEQQVWHNLLEQIASPHKSNDQIIIATSDPLYGEFIETNNDSDKTPQQNWSDLIDNMPNVSCTYSPSGNLVSDIYPALLDEIECSLNYTENINNPQYEQLLKLISQRDRALITINHAKKIVLLGLQLLQMQAKQSPMALKIGIPISAWRQARRHKVSNLILTLAEKRLTKLNNKISALIEVNQEQQAIASALDRYHSMIDPEQPGLTAQLPWIWQGDLTKDIQHWQAQAKAYLQRQTPIKKPIQLVAHSKNQHKITTGEQISADFSINSIELQAIAVDQRAVLASADNTNTTWYNQTLLQKHNSDAAFNPKDPQGNPIRPRPPRICDIATWSGQINKDIQAAYGTSDQAIFPWRIAKVIMAFQPTITIKLSQHSYQKLDKSSSIQHNSVLGYIKKNTETQSISWNDSTSTVVINDQSQYPMILGFVMELMPGKRQVK